MTSEGWTTEWMFRLLDYEHYRVFHRGIELGLIVINHEDRSVAIQLFDDVDSSVETTLNLPYKRMRRWLRDHESPALT